MFTRGSSNCPGCRLHNHSSDGIRRSNNGFNIHQGHSSTDLLTTEVFCTGMNVNKLNSCRRRPSSEVSVSEREKRLSVMVG